MEKDKVRSSCCLAVIGGSAGSLDAILKILPCLNTGAAYAVVIVQHRKPLQDSPLADILSDKTGWSVKEVEEKETVTPGTVYIAPADYHLLFETDHSFSLDASEKVNYSRPSIDVTFESAADVYGSSVIGILLSGANADGVEGLQKIRDAGGICIVQDPATAEVSYMPAEALRRLQPDLVLPAEGIGMYLNAI
ncbi:chemotaxis protein CheB [Sediminibacterium ginsengisoli]|uniref:protein-glutamate methylesterase n=1 Tax=Sediminibacterium ginsengisoli TaxID=413434 RepID=A0A1T4K219_9BACT|nr:chemotaxis protein CheB [Sediminibacterium ginsengisoli]SJZ36516.1 CheB methylesterase [Sediminibacterium ginsengisoli]